MDIKDLIKQLNDMLLLYGNKVIITVTVTDETGAEYRIKSISGKPCAKYFEPLDKVAEVIISVKMEKKLKVIDEMIGDRETLKDPEKRKQAGLDFDGDWVDFYNKEKRANE